VISIPKKRDSIDANDYQLLTPVPELSKVLERIITKHLVSSANKHNMFRNSQYGFRKLNSTKGALVM
jgi:hypothetical protein